MGENNVNQENEKEKVNQASSTQEVKNEMNQEQVAQNTTNNQQYQGYQNMNNGQQYQQNSQEPPIPEKYRPIGAWGYFGYSLLFMLPIAGLIIAIVFACDSSNINRRNYARAQFCWLIIVAIILVLVFAVGCGTYNSIRSSLYF